MKQKFEELYQELLAHLQKNEDPELQEILTKYRQALDTMDSEEEGGGNSPGRKPPVP